MSVVTARQRYAACKVADSLQLRCVDFKFGTRAQPQAWDHKNLSQVNAIQAKLQALTPKMPLTPAAGNQKEKHIQVQPWMRTKVQPLDAMGLLPGDP